MLAVSQHHPPDRYHIHLANSLPDHGEGVVANLAVRTEIVRADNVAGVDFFALHELIDLDGPRGFQRDVFELFLGHLDVGVGVDFEGLDDVLVRHFLAGVGVHARVLDAVAGVPVDLVEADLFGIGRGRIERDGTGDERKAQKAFPVGARCHRRGLRLQLDSRRTGGLGSDIPPARPWIPRLRS